jgi:predicted transcriptional regulator
MFVFRTFFTLMSFYQNQDYISTELCEKKEIANNSCQGSCQLKKQMSNLLEHEAPQQDSKNTKQTTEESLHTFTDQWKFDYNYQSQFVVNHTVFLFSDNAIDLDLYTPPPQFS